MNDRFPRKSFDCVQWTRNVRNRMYEETKHMTPEERVEWRRSKRPTDPFLARMWDNAEGRREGRENDDGAQQADVFEGPRLLIEVVHYEAAGRYIANSWDGCIHAQADSLDEIRANVKQEVDRHLEATAPTPRPKYICMRFLRDEVIPV